MIMETRSSLIATAISLLAMYSVVYSAKGPRRKLTPPPKLHHNLPYHSAYVQHVSIPVRLANLSSNATDVYLN